MLNAYYKDVFLDGIRFTAIIDIDEWIEFREERPDFLERAYSIVAIRSDETEKLYIEVEKESGLFEDFISEFGEDCIIEEEEVSLPFKQYELDLRKKGVLPKE